MERQGGVHALGHTGLHHGSGPHAPFFPRLEHQSHGARQLVLMRFQQLCRPQQHGGMHVVSAQMSIVVL